MKFSTAGFAKKAAALLVASAFGTVAMCGIAVAATQTEVEPDNSWITACPVEVGNTVYGLVDTMSYINEHSTSYFYGFKSGTEFNVFDAYSFVAPASGKITVSLSHEHQITSKFNLNLTVVGGDKSEVADSYISLDGKKKNGSISFQIKEGETYYIGLSKSTQFWDRATEWDGESYYIKTQYYVNAPKIKTLTAGKGSFTVTHTIDRESVGYEISYKKAGSSKWVTKTVKSPVAKTFTAKSLVKGKSYSVKVRTCKDVAGKTYKSAWSATKSVTVK